MKYNNIDGVPNFEEYIIDKKKNKYCLCIPIINEGNRIIKELEKAKKNNINNLVDIIICDGGSTDDSTKLEKLKKLGVNSLLIKTGDGKQGAQLRMGFYWALKRGYDGIITIDGNDKDSIEDVPKFIQKLEDGYDFVQGSRFIKGGRAINTPLSRYLAVKLLHAPIISLTAGKKYTDTTNAYRAYSKKYLEHKEVNIFRDIFNGYELLAYLSVRADQLNLKTCEVPVTRAYPEKEKTPTKISPIKGNINLFKILINNIFGKYTSKKEFFTKLFVLFSFILIILFQIIFYSKIKFAQMTPDSYDYISITTKSILLDGINLNRVPVYPIIIDLLRHISVNYKIILCIFQMILFYISTLYIYKIIIKLTKNRILGSIIALIYGCAPYLLIFNKAILTESLSLSLIIFWIYEVLKILESNSNKKFFILCLQTIIMVLLKPVFLYLLVLILLYPMYLILKKEKYLVKFLISLIPITSIVLYGFMFYSKSGVFTLTTSSINQKFIISLQRKYYINNNSNKIANYVSNNVDKDEWEILNGIYKNKTSLKELNEYNKIAFKENKNHIIPDTYELLYKISNYDYYGGYFTIKEQYNYNTETYLYKSKFLGFAFFIYNLKLIDIYILIIIMFVICIVKFIMTKKIPIIDILFLGLIAMPLIIAVISTNAEYPRTCCVLLPAAYVYLAILMYYIIENALKLHFENRILVNEKKELRNEL